jgi:hypothetical protein
MKSFISACAIVAAIAGAVSNADAAGVYVGHVSMNNSYGTTGGGEFRATVQGDWTWSSPSRTLTNFEGSVVAANGVFETFCLEKYENVSMGTTYKAYINTTTQSSDTDYNGGAHGGNADPLDARTAYLYTRFISKSLTSGYNYTNATSRAADANALQTAIWFIEGEDTTALSGKALAFFTEATTAVSNGSWSGLGEVRIMNLVTDAGANAQDQLIMGPATVVIPLPGAAGMAGLGLAGVALRRRRK